MERGGLARAQMHCEIAKLESGIRSLWQQYLRTAFLSIRVLEYHSTQLL